MDSRRVNEGRHMNVVTRREEPVLSEDVKLAQERSRQRYWESRRKYNEYFLKCLEDIEALQPNAFAGVQVSRVFTVGILPKYCKIKDPLTPKQRKRVERIIQG